MIPYGKQHITQEDIDAVVQVLQSDFLTQGPKIAEFENAFAAYIGCKYAVAVANGTAALHLSALALGVNSSTNVITTPITFCASANCIRYCGGNVFFADIDAATLTLDINKVEELILSKPAGFFSGIIPVDFAGLPVNMEAFKVLADKYGLWILEDACHAPGGYFIDSKGEKQQAGNGNFAELAIFSFHPVKHIATGEGGMITTNDDKLYHKLLQLRSHGMVYQGNDKLIENHGGWYMEMQELGFNYRLSDIQAALGISQLTKAGERLRRRNEIAAIYNKAFEGTNVEILSLPANIYHAYHLYIIQVSDRKKLYDELRKNKIFAQVHYVPVHLMPYYKNIDDYTGKLPRAENYYAKCLSIPMYPTLSNDEQEFVINMIKSHSKSEV
ncbi:MAG: UDP-4-amino-4,6-dideoxy-N-acetyl-beta-L-altrosamine transaminase [Chitinophagaceae bacterium]|nr:UDP-4-amino-4,6-dideoxy-N-acetyl-beta-L-altrosamine transaminase [Chitinophagaceae bacterium]